MKTEALSRTRTLIGDDAVKKLEESKVAVFGIGGVGSYCVEALARAGIGTIALIDRDTVEESNLNRQLIADNNTLGRSKVSVAAQRIHSINPDCRILEYEIFYLPETSDRISLSEFDYIADAIDTVTGKLCIIENAYKADVPVISSMGTGNKLDPTAFEVADIYKTDICPLARVMRRECKKRGIDHLKVVYSRETPVLKEQTPASISFVPPVAGMIMAGEIIKDLIKVNK